jgi:hypothetical protein
MIATRAPLLREVKASYAFVERNVHLSKRYWGWELTFLLYTVAQSAAIMYIPASIGSVTGAMSMCRSCCSFWASAP